MMRPTETRVGRVDTTTMNKDTRVEDWSGNKEIVSVLTALSISTLGSLVYMRTAKRAKLDAELTRRNINSVTSIELQDEAKAVVRASRKRKAPAKDKNKPAKKASKPKKHTNPPVSKDYGIILSTVTEPEYTDNLRKLANFEVLFDATYERDISLRKPVSLPPQQRVRRILYPISYVANNKLLVRQDPQNNNCSYVNSNKAWVFLDTLYLNHVIKYRLPQVHLGSVIEKGMRERPELQELYKIFKTPLQRRSHFIQWMLKTEDNVAQNKYYDLDLARLFQWKHSQCTTWFDPKQKRAYSEKPNTREWPAEHRSLMRTKGGVVNAVDMTFKERAQLILDLVLSSTHSEPVNTRVDSHSTACIYNSQATLVVVHPSAESKEWDRWIKGNKHEKPKAKQKKKQNKRQKKQGKGKDSTVKEETVSSSSSSSSSSDTGAAAEDDDSAYNRLSKAQRLKKMKQMKKINIVDIRTANRQRAVTYKDILQADLIITTTSVLLGDRRVEGRGTFSATTASNESLKEYDRCTIASDYSNYDHNNFGDSHNNMHVRRKKTSLNQFYHLQRYTDDPSSETFPNLRHFKFQRMIYLDIGLSCYSEIAHLRYGYHSYHTYHSASAGLNFTENLVGVLPIQADSRWFFTCYKKLWLEENHKTYFQNNSRWSYKSDAQKKDRLFNISGHSYLYFIIKYIGLTINNNNFGRTKKDPIIIDAEDRRATMTLLHRHLYR